MQRRKIRIKTRPVDCEDDERKKRQIKRKIVRLTLMHKTAFIIVLEREEEEKYKVIHSYTRSTDVETSFPIRQSPGETTTRRQFHCVC